MQLELTAGNCKMPLAYPRLAQGPRVNKFQALINKDKLSASLSLPPSTQTKLSNSTVFSNTVQTEESHFCPLPQ